MCLQATVGAGLPVISTLSDLMQTGDQMLHIEGILSGTLSFIFNSFGAGKTFSQVVADAKAKGFTEPDPREDLAGARFPAPPLNASVLTSKRVCSCSIWELHMRHVLSQWLVSHCV